MKNLILGTTAIVAASTLAAAPTVAAEKIKLGLSGYLLTSFVVADYDGGNKLPTDIRSEGEVHFTGETTLDNGLTFGVNIQLEARESTDQIDETYMYVEGSFGRINFGSENAASYLMHYASPSPVVAWGLNVPYNEAGGFTKLATLPTEISDADKITYFTPRFSGLQFGVSYTPDADEETGTGAASPYAVIKDEGAADGAYSIGANYTGKLGAVELNASLGYDLITRTTSDDTDEISTGFNVGISGFTAGAGYKYTDNDSGTDDRERHDYNVGLTYGQGPWSVGVQYAGVDLDNAADGHLDAVVVGGNYILGPGITAFGGVQFFSGDDDLEGSEGEEATVFFLGTALSF